MSLYSKPPWHHSARQQVRDHYANLKDRCPDGIYVAPYPGYPLQWSGVLFVRRGPYSPAILSFQIRFPNTYPYRPPTITFTTDIFHPLIVPLTTYSGTSASEPLDPMDNSWLPPGGFSLRHGFPQWYSDTDATLDPFTSSEPVDKDTEESNCILDILTFMGRAFNEDDFLDLLPQEAAGNIGAWKAWRAYRANLMLETGGSLGSLRSLNDPEEWKWDGVWESRVRRGIDTSVSESVLFGGALSGIASDDPIRFVVVDPDLLDEIQLRMRSIEGT